MQVRASLPAVLGRCVSLQRSYKHSSLSCQYSNLRPLQDDCRTRLSRFWVPTGGIARTTITKEDSHSLLIRAGVLRQAYSGVFHLLPLGLRIQEKIERLIEKHMSKLGASKLSLSSISSEDLWRRSGRFESSRSELFHFHDRRDAKYLLSPTHEEEITLLVGSIVKSYRELPIRLYQISRKYRDEPRPRQGLLRTREFLMKDLYTFDLTRAQALETYYAVRDAYCSFFDSFKIPYLVAEADSGTMGGNLSHEFHFLTTKGEDNVIRCSDCQYVANEELARSGEILPELNQIGEIPEHNVWAYECEHEPSQNPPKHLGDADIATTPLYFTTWTGVTRDRRTLVLVHYPRNPISGQFVGSTSVSENEVNPYGVKALVDQVDAGVETPVQAWAKAFVLSRKGDNVTNEHSRIVRLFDYRMRGATFDVSTSLRSLGFTVSDLIRGLCPEDLRVQDIFIDPLTNRPLDLLKIRNGDPCPKCSSGHLTVHRAVELGHTFFLGTRYSKALQATVAISSSLEDEGKPRDSGTEASTFQGHDFGEGAEQKGQSILEMGCHGIGISRMIAVVADSLADRKGLNWPRVIAPFDVVLIPSKGEEDAATEVYDRITASGLRRGFPGPSVYTAPLEDTIDVIIDDRARDLAWKLGDADLIGYPVIVVLGRAWRKDRKCEVQCRRIRDLRTEVSLDDLSAFILSLLKQL